jgi:hypothetical protein
MEAAMHGFDELARLLAAPIIADPLSCREDEDTHRKKEPPRDRDREEDSHHLDEFEHIEVGDPRDGP